MLETSVYVCTFHSPSAHKQVRTNGKVLFGPRFFEKYARNAVGLLLTAAECMN